MDIPIEMWETETREESTKRLQGELEPVLPLIVKLITERLRQSSTDKFSTGIGYYVNCQDRPDIITVTRGVDVNEELRDFEMRIASNAFIYVHPFNATSAGQDALTCWVAADARETITDDVLRELAQALGRKRISLGLGEKD